MERPNTRIGQVKRHLARVPKAAEVLQLQVAQSPESMLLLGEWHRDDVVPELAEEVLLVLEEHAETVRASITAQLVYLTDHGVRVGSQKVLTQSPPSMSDAPELVTPSGVVWSTAAQMTGDSQSQAAQAQRHAEVITKTLVSAIGMMGSAMRQSNEQVLAAMTSANQQVMVLCETLASRLSESETRVRDSIQRADDAEAYLRESIEAAKSDDKEESSEAVDRLMKFLEPLAPVILGQLMAPAQPPPRPPARVEEKTQGSC